MNLLYDIIILPIESIIEFVFCFFFYKIGKFGVIGAICAVSLAVNFLALPIYNIADEIQLKERELQKRMSRWVKHIKTTFKGDEQFMMLSEYYRQNNYHPLFTLRQSLSVLIQIPFFIAAYNFLSHCALLENQSAMFLSDLSKPDSLIAVAGFRFNLLPILMTAINVVSSIIYTKDAPFREKIQAFLLAGIFLLLLYNSPSGLVFYWVLNQIFSLCKNIVKKMKHPGWIVYGFFIFMLLCVSAYLLLFKYNRFSSTRYIILLIAFSTVLLIVAPFALRFARKKEVLKNIRIQNVNVTDKQNFILLLVSCLSLCLLCGLLLPSSVISTSPTEFSFLGNTSSPLNYVWSALLFFAGLFVFWPLVIYKMFSENKIVKIVMPPLFFVIALCALANAYLFKYDYGSLTVFFNSDNINFVFNLFFSLLPLLFMSAVIVLILFAIRKKFFDKLVFVPLIILLTEFSIGTYNVSKINKSFKTYQEKAGTNNIVKTLEPEFNFSRSDNNVVIILLDRAISDFFPIALEQFPELKKSFSGFVYYPNCLSLGESTISTVPSLMGGYEYSPEEINKRADEKLVDKHNESLRVMPMLFSEAGYNIELADPPWMNYEAFFYEGGLFADIPDAKVFPLETKFGSKYIIDHEKELPKIGASDVVCSIRAKHFSILQVLYPPVRRLFYNYGSYFISQEKNGADRALDYYAELYYLPELTEFKSNRPTFKIIYNETPHEYISLIDLPMSQIGESEYKSEIISSDACKVNILALIQVAKWLDYLKENECYDNTRIIIVADHGRDISTIRFKDFTEIKDAGYFNPLFIVKDFNSHGDIVTDNSLVTNAETINFAIKDLGIKPENPITKNKLLSVEDFSSFNVYKVFREGQRNAFNYKSLKQFPLNPKDGYAVHDDILNESNWRKLDDVEVLK